MTSVATVLRTCQSCAKRFEAYSPTARHCSDTCRQAAYLRRMQAAESALQRKVLELARMYGWRVYHTYNSQRSAAGFPDLVLVRRPRVIFAELKSASGTFPREQLDWLDDLDHCPGVETYRWRPSDLAEIQRVLQ